MPLTVPPLTVAIDVLLLLQVVPGTLAVSNTLPPTQTVEEPEIITRLLSEYTPPFTVTVVLAPQPPPMV
jgi:hypothetical protein